MSAAGTGIDPEMASKIKLPGLSFKTIATATNSANAVPRTTTRPVLPTSKSHQGRRNMSSNNGNGTPKVKTDWLVILPDQAEALEKRMGVRP